MCEREILNYHDLRDMILENRLSKTSESLGKITVLYNEVYVEGSEEEHKRALKFFEEKLGNKFINNGSRCLIKLDTQTLRVFFEEPEEDNSLKLYPFRPLLEDIALLNQNSCKTNISTQFKNTSKGHNDTPHLHAFFSYKGGVGRTMHILAAARYFAEESVSTFSKPQVLLIDADTEAPGLTWWAKERLPGLKYSYLDLLADIYDSGDYSSEIIKYAADKISLSRLELGSPQYSVFFLPVFRDILQMMRPPVVPEKLTYDPNQPWLLGNILLDLGKALNVKHIFIDLRAGMSELASPLFFDPRIRRVLFTTTSRQSVEGTCCVLNQLAKMASLLRQYDNENIYSNNTNVIINFIPPNEVNSVKLTNISKNIMTEWQGLLSKDECLDSDSWLFQSYYDQNLLGLDSLEQTLAVLDNSVAVQDACKALWKNLLPGKRLGISGDLRKQDIMKLAEKTRKLIFAEHVDFSHQIDWKERFLQIEPYRQLASSFSSSVPNALIIGAKGSGKTYFYLQLAAMKTWETFCKTLSFDNKSTIQMVPIAWSETVDSAELKALSKKLLKEKFGTNLKEDSHYILRNAFSTVKCIDELEWSQKWYRYILELLNISFSCDDDLRSVLRNNLAKQTEKIVFLMDGMEDIFSAWLAQDALISPLRVLLVDLIRDIYEWSNGNIGFLIFIRKDIVRRAIPQNSSQFIAKYSSYELDWSKTEALRLVGWILFASSLGKYCKKQSMSSWYTASFDAMTVALEPFWGLKLGAPNSKEAYSVNWILSALSDFKGHIQARDMVRFIHEASRLSLNEEKFIFKDRLIMPKILKAALKPCGEEKIKEIKQEMQEVKVSIEKLEGSRKSIPLEKKDFEELEIQNISVLEDFGFIFNEDGKYYFPAIYRDGLGLRESTSARPKVVSLMRKALARS